MFDPLSSGVALKSPLYDDIISPPSIVSKPPLKTMPVVPLVILPPDITALVPAAGRYMAVSLSLEISPPKMFIIDMPKSLPFPVMAVPVPVTSPPYTESVLIESSAVSCLRNMPFVPDT